MDGAVVSGAEEFRNVSIVAMTDQDLVCSNVSAFDRYGHQDAKTRVLQ